MITTWPEEVLSGIIGMHSFLLGAEEDRISGRDHGADCDDLVYALVLLRLENGFGEHWIDRELGHSSPQLRQVSVIVQCAEGIEMLKGSDEGLRRRWIHEVKVNQIVDT